LEFSTDNGQTWIDYLTDTLFNSCYEFENSFSFTGSSSEWQYFLLNIIFPVSEECFNMQQGDTMWYKFTFISDDIQSGQDGWMIDNIHLWDFIEGINNSSVSNTSLNIYPNPTQDYIVFQLSGKSSSAADNKSQILITNSFGQPIAQLPFAADKITWECRHLPVGIYFYQFQTNEKTYSGKFLIID
jgi:hypothetical protein